MKNLKKSGFFLLVFLFGLAFPFFASANTISNTYQKAFLNPYEFEDWLFNKIANRNFTYFQQFRGCVQRGSRFLDDLERKEGVNYWNCENDPKCHEAAKDVKQIRKLKHNVNNLMRYISNIKSGRSTKYVHTEIGRGAVSEYELHKTNGTSVNRSLVFQQHLRILLFIRCP